MIVGRIIIWAGEFSKPNIESLRRKGFLPCDGRFLSEIKFPELFSIVQDNYKINGEVVVAGKFRIPDLRGRVTIGSGMGFSTTDRLLGNYLGTETVTLGINQIPTHTHPVGPLEVGHTVNGNGNSTRIDADDGTPWNHLTYRLEAGPVGGGEAHGNMQPSLAINYLIRYRVSKKMDAMVNLSDDEYEELDV